MYGLQGQDKIDGPFDWTDISKNKELCYFRYDVTSDSKNEIFKRAGPFRQTSRNRDIRGRNSTARI